MRLKVPMIVVAAVILICCSNTEKDNGWDVSITGKVNFVIGGEISIQDMKPNGKKDTIVLKSDKTFAKTLHISEPGYYQINFYGRQFINVILDHANLEVNVDGNDPMGFAEVKGSPDHELITEVNQIIRDVQTTAEFAVLEKEFEAAAKKGNQEEITGLQGKYQEMVFQAHDKIVSILASKPVSLGMINIMQNNNMLDADRYMTFYDSTAKRIQREWPNSFYGKEFVSYVDKLKITAIGQHAPEIKLPNPSGDTITLSSLKGKYVLVDFWAKWCGPCRRENPNVVKAYHRFKDKGFEVFGVSLDRNREDWVKAIQEDGLVWTHVSDLKYFESRAAKDYNISAIPFSILVDPQGVIIAKNLRGGQLEKKLKEVFPGS